MADLGEEAFSSQMKVVATFLRLLEELMRNKQQDLRYGTKTQRRGILGRMKDFVGESSRKSMMAHSDACRVMEKIMVNLTLMIRLLQSSLRTQ